MTLLKEFFLANSTLIKKDNYPFTDDYERVLYDAEALISVKMWLLEKRKELDVKRLEAESFGVMYSTASVWQHCIDDLLKELEEVPPLNKTNQTTVKP